MHGWLKLSGNCIGAKRSSGGWIGQYWSLFPKQQWIGQRDRGRGSLPARHMDHLPLKWKRENRVSLTACVYCKTLESNVGQGSTPHSVSCLIVPTHNEDLDRILLMLTSSHFPFHMDSSFLMLQMFDCCHTCTRKDRVAPAV